ncbi:MAG: sigma-54 dependent transcriptional regulator [Gammaproteobacteria bacterium]|nr:sigma-54 dependent transcriptional regulator [Gammaproteobacteria bacterium]
MTSNKSIKALIIDDEPDLCELAEITLSRMGLSVRTAYTVQQAIELLKTETFNLCITDMNLPDGDGIEVINFIQKHHSEIPVAVITAYGNMELAIKALKLGAFDFVSKPVDLHVLRNLVNSAIKLPGLKNTSAKNTGKYTLLGESEVIKDLNNKIQKLARSQAPVYIYGESGCGKELTAHLIHEYGARVDSPFIAVNCGAIPTELMESEFFGHIKGSFTGANTDKDGLFKSADGGTLFLDEVADLPLQMQVKLLRAIQEKAIRPIGSTTEESIDVRILSASHKDLTQLVSQGKFREDLFYRINVIELVVPPLREHSEDIQALAEFLMQRLCDKSNFDSMPTLNEDALKELCEYSFPGNVRELENILERALAMSENNKITIQDLQLPKNKPHKHSPVPIEHKNLNTMELATQEKDSILQALEQTRWNKTAAAKLLGITLRQLRYRLEKLDID